MLSKKDQAIKENILKPHAVQTFYKYIKIVGDCHLWQGQITDKGYGRFDIYLKGNNHSVAVRPHRFAYALKHGFDALPAGSDGKGERMVINHLCHNRSCVNPGHLEPVTHKENVSVEKRKPKDGAA